MDFVESAKSQWAGRYSWGDENQANQGLTLDGTKIITNYEQYMGSNTRVITPNLVNEARFGYNRFFNSIGTYLAFNTDVVSQIGIPNFPGGAPVTWGIPNVTLIGYSSALATARKVPMPTTTTRCSLWTTSRGSGASILPLRRGVHASELRSGGKPVRARPVHLPGERDVEPAPSPAAILLPTSCWAPCINPKRPSPSPTPISSATLPRLCGRHVEGHSQAYACVGSAL